MDQGDPDFQLHWSKLGLAEIPWKGSKSALDQLYGSGSMSRSTAAKVTNPIYHSGLTIRKSLMCNVRAASDVCSRG